MIKVYRKGAIGALMDEYERAAWDLRVLIEATPADRFAMIVDSATRDENCRSIQTILSHVVSAGYGYSDSLRDHFSIASTRPAKRLLLHEETVPALDAMLQYTAETLEGKWEMKDEEILRVVIEDPSGIRSDMEQLLEHAIVHILRHRRQVEKFLRKLGGAEE